MRQRTKVNIFLAILVIIAIIIAIFALRGPNFEPPTSAQEYEDICCLTDTIKALKEDIAKYELEIERINIKRESIKKELEQIIKSNEKIDTELANGDWDDNIKFLSDFLSEEDTFRK